MDYIKRHRKRDNAQISWERAEWIAMLAKKHAPEMMKVLDLGCGKGRLTSEFLNKGISAYGIDLRNVFEYDKSRFVFGEARNLPFKDESFDGVCEAYWFSDMIELQGYRHEKIRQATEESLRILKPGGFFISYPGFCVNLSFFGFEDLTPKTPYYENRPISIYQKPQKSNLSSPVST